MGATGDWGGNQRKAAEKAETDEEQTTSVDAWSGESPWLPQKKRKQKKKGADDEYVGGGVRPLLQPASTPALLLSDHDVEWSAMDVAPRGSGV